MSIRMKILLPVIILTIVMVAAILGSNIWQFSNYVDANIEERVNSAASVAANELEMLKAQANSASLYLAEDPAIGESLKSGNRDALLTLATQLQEEAGIEFCTVTDAAGTVLVRTHNPGSFGDDLSTRDYVATALSGKQFTGVTKGSDIAFSVRAGVPVIDGNDVIIGTISAGFRLDNNSFVDSVKALMGCEVTVFLGDERLSTTVVKDDGTRAVGTKAAENVSQIVLAGKSFSGLAKILEREALTKYSPIMGSDGKALGMLFVGRYMAEKTDTVMSFVRVGLLITLVLLIISVAIVLVVVGRIVTPIHMMVNAARALAVGDNDINIQVRTKDEMRKLADAFNEMIANTRNQVQTIEAIASGDLTVSVETRSDKDMMNQALVSMVNNNNGVFSQIIDAATQVSTGSRQIADSAQTLAQGATEQAATVEQLTVSISEVDAKTKDSAFKADQAATLAEKIKNNAEKGSQQMDRMVEAVKDISEASQSINKIIKVIDDIAFQTNILALNAAVEAARAGQHGKGFAVVADEVRNLAAKSAEAARETGFLIENSMEKSEMGARIADETAASLSEIVLGINESSRLVEEIARFSEHQSAAITQLNNGINQVAMVVQQNSATSQQSAAASEEMSGQAMLLQNLVSRFKLKNNFAIEDPASFPPGSTSAPYNTAFSVMPN